MSSKTAEKYSKQLVRNREMKWVRLGLIKINPVAQREQQEGWIDYLAANMNLDELGTPELNFRDGVYYAMDGAHRIKALAKWLGTGWEDQCVQCWVSHGLTEQEEAETFLRLQNRLGVKPYSKFMVSITASRKAECEINEIVKSERLVISKEKLPCSIRCVGTLLRVYKRDGAQSLRRALALSRDAFGDAGMEAPIIDGFGALCNRYNGNLRDSEAIESLSNIHGGVNGLLGLAETLRRKTGAAKSHCVAASAVSIINRARSGKNKLPAWWKE